MTAKTLIIHTGFHKTASTSVQVALSEYHRDAGAARRLHYVESFRTGPWPHAHHSLSSGLLSSDAEAYRMMEELDREIHATDCDHFVISCEDFCRPERVYTLNYLAALTSVSEIVGCAFVRDHDYWFESYYSEEIKRGRIADYPMDFLTKRADLLCFSDRIEDICANLPSSNMKILHYYQSLSAKEMLLRMTGVAIDVRPKWENRSLSPLLIYAVRELNEARDRLLGERLGLEIDRLYALDRQIKPLRSSYSILDHRERALIYEVMARDSALVSKRYFGLTKPFWSIPRPDIDMKPPENAALAFLMDMVLKLDGPLVLELEGS